METSSKRNMIIPRELFSSLPGFKEGNLSMMPYSRENIDTEVEKKDKTTKFFQNYLQSILDETLQKFITPTGKQSFLVFKHNKYIPIPTESIAFFYVKYESSIIVTFDRQEYFVNYSLDEIQQLLSDRLFTRLNRQYVVNFNAIKEVEHYFARKLLVNLTIPTQEKVLVSKEKASGFLNWLESR
ncbi:MAG: LytTR family DNA-binding domain-containing protein [Ferruginibacter sp.]|nr:LytTR family DNA-binding domain-containing protein [Ferruginibacter sp.]